MCHTNIWIYKSSHANLKDIYIGNATFWDADETISEGLAHPTKFQPFTA